MCPLWKPCVVLSAGGVKVFNTGKGESVVSVAWIADQGEEDQASKGDAGDDPAHLEDVLPVAFAFAIIVSPVSYSASAPEIISISSLVMTA